MNGRGWDTSMQKRKQKLEDKTPNLFKKNIRIAIYKSKYTLHTLCYLSLFSCTVNLLSFIRLFILSRHLFTSRFAALCSLQISHSFQTLSFTFILSTTLFQPMQMQKRKIPGSKRFILLCVEELGMHHLLMKKKKKILEK